MACGINIQFLINHYIIKLDHIVLDNLKFSMHISNAVKKAKMVGLMAELKKLTPNRDKCIFVKQQMQLI